MEKDLDIKLYNDYLDGEKGAFDNFLIEDSEGNIEEDEDEEPDEDDLAELDLELSVADVLGNDSFDLDGDDF